jgi:hypothetical protein
MFSNINRVGVVADLVARDGTLARLCDVTILSSWRLSASAADPIHPAKFANPSPRNGQIP